MKRCHLSLALAILCSGCVRSPPGPPPVPVEEDKSIVFPPFFEHEPVRVGSGGGPYELDGELLRAVMIAAQDLLPPGTPDRPCGSRLEAQRYRVIRQGTLFFVYIHEDHAYCGRKYPALDSGAKYAISADGRILRRVLDGQPEHSSPPESPDAGPRGIPAQPGVLPGQDALWNEPAAPASPDAGPASQP